MPYCNKCGANVGERDPFCSNCGSRQPVETPAATRVDPLAGLQPRTASLLCYVPLLGLVASIIVLASSQFRSNRTVRFHAFQGLYIFVAWLLVERVVGPIFGWPHGFFGGRLIVTMLEATLICAWIFMMIKAFHDEAYKLPVLGDLAEKSVAEQR